MHKINMITFETAQISLQLAGQNARPTTTQITNILPDQNPSPFLFSFPHSGHNYTQNFVATSRLDFINLRSSEDAYVDQLFTQISHQGGNKLSALFPRAFVDVNRLANDLDPALFIEPLNDDANIYAPLIKAGLGVIPRVVAHQQNIYHSKISLTQGQSRLDKHYHPYHSLLETLTTSAQIHYGFSLLIDCHSMPSRFSKNQPAPDFIIGDLHGQSCNRHVSETIYKHFQSCGFSVRLNQPYAGGAITRKYQTVQLGLHSVQLEINRGLYMDEKRIQKTENFTQIENILTGLSQKIIDIKPEYLIPYQNAAE
ncbi:MAG: N-formylglutamate amidohydrolase [Hyphomicrobiales bacterium]|nr:MAG: N-formylglutamate amidohydrolase [Hyphomicrobiales bacterium]